MSIAVKNLENVTIDEVKEFNGTRYEVSDSYLQTDRHINQSDRYHTIQPASVGSVLAEHNFKLISLLTGRAKHEDKRSFQRTISRYRSEDAFEIDGVSLDIIYIGKHLGRGCDELILGFFRGTCANQWNAGTNFEVVKIRHTANAVDGIREGIAALLEQRAKLIETIKKMQATTLSLGQITELAEKFAEIRLAEVKNLVSFDSKELATVRREEDKGNDLFTIMNVLQENAVRTRLSYQVNSTDKNGNPRVRYMSTRLVRESSVKMVELNAQFFNEALKLVA